MKRSMLIPLLLTLTACGAPAGEGPGPMPDAGPLGVILFIGDGAGLTYWSAAKLATSMPLGVESFPVVGLVDTEASNSPITDSAAGATAFASGVRTFNGAIGVGPDTTVVETVLEVAESRNWATGLVATATVTHATPAAFAAHVPSRNMHDEIARHMAGQGIEVVMGGGRNYFDPAVRADSVDLLSRLIGGGSYVDSSDAFYALDMDTVASLVGFFAPNNPGTAIQRSPGLPDMTEVALRVLEKDRDGFFLMVEGSQIDWRGHENAPIQEVLVEVQDFDLAIKRALAFQERRPNTLIIVVADHSTGGLALHGDEVGVFGAHYTTEGHTADMVPMFARGPGQQSFGGVMDNDRVGRLLLEIVRSGETAGIAATTSH